MQPGDEERCLAPALTLSPGLKPLSALRAADEIPVMNKTNLTALPPEESLADLVHFAWCALVGLRLAQQDGQAFSPLTIHTFLLRWLVGAQKQRRFPRSVAVDIDSLLRLGRQKGLAAGLSSRLEYIWHSWHGAGISAVGFVPADACD